MKKLLLVLFGSAFVLNLFAQEALKSTEEDYYDLLTLNGVVERPTLNYRTLSDNKYNILDQEKFDVFPWTAQNLGQTKKIFDLNNPDSNWFIRGFDRSLSYKLYGPEEFLSYNSKAPFGQNDGALWQGRGLNSSFTTGIRLEGYGFELTFKPQLTYSQNKDFEIIKTSNTSRSEYAYFYGNCDAPQRFGDDSFSKYSWGDSEVRWNYRTFTVGFGTQSIWSGPSYENATMLSNTGVPFPKLDFGFRKTEIIVPYLGWSLGEVETRFFYGKLSESDYFDNDSGNNHNLLSGFTISYAPTLDLLKGLTLGVTKICLSKWGHKTSQYINPGFNGNTLSSKDDAGEDQFAALTADWVFPSVGFELYGELGFDDLLANGYEVYEYQRYPFHTMTYTVGLKKSFTISEKRRLYGVFNFEWNNTETSQDYQMWPGSTYNFAFHHQISQGKTNEGQWLGSGIGYGGNSQMLSFKLYSPHGFEKIVIGRNNPDNNYIWSKTVDQPAINTVQYFASFKANFYAGAETMWYITPSLSVDASVLYNLIINPKYEQATGYTYNGLLYFRYDDKHSWNNYRFTLKAKYTL